MCQQKFRCGGGTVKEGFRIIATTFLSLLLPLSFLLLARYFSSTANHNPPQYSKFLITSDFKYINTTLILSSLILLITIGALIHGLSYGGVAACLMTTQRRRFYFGWTLLSLIEICLCLGIQRTGDVEIKSYNTVGSLALSRRVVLFVGLHETMVFWWRSAVAPVVDEAVFGFYGDELRWVEKVALWVGYCNLWWRRVRKEAEALVMLPSVMSELRVTDVLGWWLYYLTAAVGVVRVVRSMVWLATWIPRYVQLARKTNPTLIVTTNV